MNSSKTIVCAAIGDPGVIGSFFCDKNVDGNLYLEMLNEKFSIEFCCLSNAPEIFFIQDETPLCKRYVWTWLYEKFPGSLTGRTGVEDSNATWPLRSPDLPCEVLYKDSSTNRTMKIWINSKLQLSSHVLTGFPRHIICSYGKLWESSKFSHWMSRYCHWNVIMYSKISCYQLPQRILCWLKICCLLEIID